MSILTASLLFLVTVFSKARERRCKFQYTHLCSITSGYSITRQPRLIKASFECYYLLFRIAYSLAEIKTEIVILPFSQSDFIFIALD